MRRVFPMFAASLALVLCTSVARADFTVTALLAGTNEVPPNASPGTGTATFVYTSATQTLSYDVSFSNLTAAAISSQISFGLPGVTGPTILPFTAPGPLPVTNGSFFGSLTASDLLASPSNGINTFADAIAAIQAGKTYVEIKSAGFIGGEIRGQIVPEPASLALSFIGAASLLGVYAARRNRAA